MIVHQAEGVGQRDGSLGGGAGSAKAGKASAELSEPSEPWRDWDWDIFHIIYGWLLLVGDWGLGGDGIPGLRLVEAIKFELAFDHVDGLVAGEAMAHFFGDLGISGEGLLLCGFERLELLIGFGQFIAELGGVGFEAFDLMDGPGQFGGEGINGCVGVGKGVRHKQWVVDRLIG
jgi:hypothetical protein